jgi:arylsulfatase A-like enzyme
MNIGRYLNKLLLWAFVAYLLGLLTALFDTVFNAFFLPFQIKGFGDGLNYFSQNVLVNTVFVLVCSIILSGLLIIGKSLVKRRPQFYALPWPFIFGASVSILIVFLVAIPVNIVKLPNFFDKKSVVANVLFCSAIPFLTGFFTLIGVYLRKYTARYNLKLAGVIVFFITAAVVFAGFFFGGARSRPKTIAPENAPNVLIITIDALRRDYVSCYEGANAETPNIDEFADRALVFTNAHTNSPWTIPAMYTMLTSLYPSVHGANINRRGVGEVPTLAERLSGFGYNTEAYVANSILYGDLGFDRGFDRYVEVADLLPLLPLRRTTVYQLFKRLREKYILAVNDNTTDWATDVLCKRLRAGRNRPFFIWVHYLDPHSPLIPPEEYVEGDEAFVENAMRFGRTKTLGSSDKVKAGDKDMALALYKAEVEYLDHRLSDVFDVLISENLAENTIVIITADHGEEFFEHGKYGHSKTHYNEVMAIPLIIRGPGIEPGVSDIPVSLLDVSPMVLGYVKAQPAPEAAGSDIIALARADEPGKYEKRPIFFDQTEFAPDMKSIFIAPYTLTRTGDSVYKYRLIDVRKVTGPEDVVKNPDPEVFEYYKSILDEWAALTAEEAESFAAGRSISINGARRNRLKDLGYF